MKKDIILGGVGGQGIVSIATIIAYAALEEGLNIKQSEVHGMAQRGGAVMSNLRISDKPIASDLIRVGGADVLIGVEPLEALRYKHYLTKDGWFITNIRPFNNIPDYPDLQKIEAEIRELPRHVIFDAEAIAETIKSKRSSNIVVLGASSPFIGVKYETLEKGIKTIFASKGEDVVNVNLKALELGRKEAEKFM